TLDPLSVVVHDDALNLDHAGGTAQGVQSVDLVQELVHRIGTGDLLLDIWLAVQQDPVNKPRQMGVKMELILGHQAGPEMPDTRDGRVGNDLVDVLGNVDVEAAVARFELEVRDRVVELDLRERLTDGFVDAGALIALVVQFLQVLLQRVRRRAAIVAGNGDSPPSIGGFGVGDEELLALRLVPEVHAQVEDPFLLQFRFKRVLPVLGPVVDVVEVRLRVRMGEITGGIRHVLKAIVRGRALVRHCLLDIVTGPRLDLGGGESGGNGGGGWRRRRPLGAEGPATFRGTGAAGLRIGRGQTISSLGGLASEGGRPGQADADLAGQAAGEVAGERFAGAAAAAARDVAGRAGARAVVSMQPSCQSQSLPHAQFRRRRRGSLLRLGEQTEEGARRAAGRAGDGDGHVSLSRRRRSG
ncbi:hypothetical protein T310_8934, partial [Rasamsonia emersonii CBS 393.64]